MIFDWPSKNSHKFVESVFKDTWNSSVSRLRVRLKAESLSRECLSYFIVFYKERRSEQPQFLDILAAVSQGQHLQWKNSINAQHPQN